MRGMRGRSGGPFLGAGLPSSGKAVRPEQVLSMDDEETLEEALESRGIKMGEKPSREEVEDHERTHLPFRNWCEHCVRGRAKNDPHQALGEEKACGTPKVSLDYAYLKEKHEGNRPEKVEGEGFPIVVMEV